MTEGLQYNKCFLNPFCSPSLGLQFEGQTGMRYVGAKGQLGKDKPGYSLGVGLGAEAMIGEVRGSWGGKAILRWMGQSEEWKGKRLPASLHIDLSGSLGRGGIDYNTLTQGILPYPFEASHFWYAGLDASVGFSLWGVGAFLGAGFVYEHYDNMPSGALPYSLTNEQWMPTLKLGINMELPTFRLANAFQARQIPVP